MHLETFYCVHYADDPHSRERALRAIVDRVESRRQVRGWPVYRWIGESSPIRIRRPAAAEAAAGRRRRRRGAGRFLSRAQPTPVWPCEQPSTAAIAVYRQT